LRPLGKVFNFSPKGSIVVRATITPRIGNVVCDNKGRPLGKVIRITGPVNSPYVLVTSAAKDEMSMYRLSGKQVFIDDSFQQRPPRERRPQSKGPRSDRKAQWSNERRPREKKDFGSKGKKPFKGKRRTQR
jgi:rRNA processing protein Gar1